MPSEYVPPQSAFDAKKAKILTQLSLPSADYTDASPKGAIDSAIAELVHEINSYNGCVTTSSCSGRISVFLDAAYAATDTFSPIADSQNSASALASGSTANRGRWLYTSHAPLRPVPLASSIPALFSLRPFSPSSSLDDGQDLRQARLVHFKFEPLILHVLTRDLPTAQALLSAAHVAGFRESGASSLEGKAGILVAVRMPSLAFDNVVGRLATDGIAEAMVPEGHLRALLEVANGKFETNTERAGRFRELLKVGLGSGDIGRHAVGWEDKDARRERKKREGLERRAELKQEGALSRDGWARNSSEKENGEENLRGIDVGVLNLGE